MSLKEAILNAAEHVCATHDYDGTSMRLIAAILSRMSSGMRRPSDERKHIVISLNQSIRK
jgi:AcrR family transcriptional regulator